MNDFQSIIEIQRRPAPPRGLGRRLGTSSLEVLVACTLLSSVLAVATPLVVKHGQLLRAQRDYRLALDELSNQLEQLQALPDARFAEAVATIAPSDFASARLPDLKLRAEVATIDTGQRLTLLATWNEIGRDRAPLSLAAWRFSAAQNLASAAAPETSP
jgi:hypothetical protein